MATPTLHSSPVPPFQAKSPDLVMERETIVAEHVSQALLRCILAEAMGGGVFGLC
jgi:hypothetical protein